MMNLREVIGYPGYLMDITDGSVWSYRNGKRKLSIYKRPNGCLVVTLQQQGKNHVLQWYRLWYAVRNNIPVHQIPKQLCVRLTDDGSLVLRNPAGLYTNMMQKKRDRLIATRSEVFRRKEHELQLMRRVYETGDRKELQEYCEGLREGTIRWYSVKHNLKTDSARLLFDAALERMILSLDAPSSLITDITANLRFLMRKEAAKNRAVSFESLREYQDAIQYSRKQKILSNL
ncbi:MAG: hypothetical protein II886_13615 [Prevotella sp.]|nr:hypothetical protein [Prevotella sp.]